MGIHVVANVSSFAADMSKGKIIVESDRVNNFGLAIEELKMIDSRNLALRYAAQKGMGDPRINGTVAEPYPVNSEGQCLDDVRDRESGGPLPPQHPRMQPAHYRVDVEVVRRLV